MQKERDQMSESKVFQISANFMLDWKRWRILTILLIFQIKEPDKIRVSVAIEYILRHGNS